MPERSNTDVFGFAVDASFEKSIKVTLSGTPGTVTVVDLPEEARGIIIRPVTNDIRFCVSNSANTRTLVALATSSSTTVAATAFTVGATIFADTSEVRLLPYPLNLTGGTFVTRKLSLSSLVASTEVYITLF